VTDRSRLFYGQQSLGSRQRQEDQFVARGDAARGPYLVVVADGMGGHSGGDIASDLAVEAFIAAYDKSSASPPPARLREALTQANRVLTETANKRPELEGMGTTLLAVAETPEGIFYISVGDSALWQVTADSLRRINADHSMRGALREMVSAGMITPEMAARHPNRNQLQSALGEQEPELIDCPDSPLDLGDSPILLLATDGIETLSEAEIFDTVRGAGGDARTAVRALLDAVAAKGHPRQDNTTAYIWQLTRGVRIAPGDSTRARRAPLGRAGLAVAMVAAVLALGCLGAALVAQLTGYDGKQPPASSAPVHPSPTPSTSPTNPGVTPKSSPVPTRGLILKAASGQQSRGASRPTRGGEQHIRNVPQPAPPPPVNTEPANDHQSEPVPASTNAGSSQTSPQAPRPARETETAKPPATPKKGPNK
jgi:serine/threonine protein phosphatase PrpC